MAVDTQLKRSSSAQMLLFCFNAPPFPTGTVSVFIRQARGHCYAGIAAAFTGLSILRQMLMHHGA